MGDHLQTAGTAIILSSVCQTSIEIYVNNKNERICRTSTYQKELSSLSR